VSISVWDSVVNFPFRSIASVTSMCTIERFIYILLYLTFCSSISVGIVIISRGANVEQFVRQCFSIRYYLPLPVILLLEFGLLVLVKHVDRVRSLQLLEDLSTDIYRSIFPYDSTSRKAFRAVTLIT